MSPFPGPRGARHVHVFKMAVSWVPSSKSWRMSQRSGQICHVATFIKGGSLQLSSGSTDGNVPSKASLGNQTLSAVVVLVLIILESLENLM